MAEIKIYFLIRHKATGEFMPEAKRNKGYTHWNPSILEAEFKNRLGVPRLIDTRRSAAKCISVWAASPNASHSFYQDSYAGDYYDIINTKDDGRKPEDLEVVEVELKIKENQS